MSWGLPDYTYWPTEYSNEHLHAHGTRTWKRHKELPVPTLWMQSFSVWMIYHLLKLLYWEHHHQNLMFQRTAVKTRWNGNARALDLEPRQGFRGLEMSWRFWYILRSCFESKQNKRDSYGSCDSCSLQWSWEKCQVPKKKKSKQAPAGSNREQPWVVQLGQEARGKL